MTTHRTHRGGVLMRFRNRRHCAHSRLRPIYGDEINFVGGWRLECRDCGRFINGPVALAAMRENESGGAE